MRRIDISHWIDVERDRWMRRGELGDLDMVRKWQVGMYCSRYLIHVILIPVMERSREFVV